MTPQSERKAALAKDIRIKRSPVTILLFLAACTAAVGATIVLDPRAESGSTQFGRALAVVGDLDNDGVSDLAVGAPFQDGDFEGEIGFGKPQNPGKIWVLSGATQNVLFTLDDPKYQQDGATPQFGGQLGFSISALPDINGDGVPDVLAGSPHHSPEDPLRGTGIINAGRAFAFSGADGSVLLTLEDPDPQEGALAGYSVAALGDVNGDGIPDMAVGVPGKNIGDEEDQLTAVGSVFIYSGANGAIIRTLSHPSQIVNARFGSSLDNAGDINHDGVSDILIGAPGNSEAFVFSGLTGALIFRIPSPVRERTPSFGAAVAGGKDLDNDGIPDFAVGAPLQKSATGAVFVFKGSDGTLQRRLRFRSPQTFARFGAVVHLSADLTGDGRPDILVGVPDQNVNGVINAGEVLIFSGADGKLFQTLTSAVPQDSAGFGSAFTTGDFGGGGPLSPVIGVPYQNASLPSGPADELGIRLQIGQIEIQ